MLLNIILANVLLGISFYIGHWHWDKNKPMTKFPRIIQWVTGFSGGCFAALAGNQIMTQWFS